MKLFLILTTTILFNITAHASQRLPLECVGIMEHKENKVTLNLEPVGFISYKVEITVEDAGLGEDVTYFDNNSMSIFSISRYGKTNYIVGDLYDSTLEEDEFHVTQFHIEANYGKHKINNKVKKLTLTFWRSPSPLDGSQKSNKVILLCEEARY